MILPWSFRKAAVNMSRMAKGRGEQSRVQLSAAGRRKRGAGGGSNLRFVRAFADALRDILKHEQRRAA
jgi:hypothetical protein